MRGLYFPHQECELIPVSGQRAAQTVVKSVFTMGSVQALGIVPSLSQETCPPGLDDELSQEPTPHLPFFYTDAGF